VAIEVPVKELRPIEDWCAELGLDRLHADLFSGDLDAYWQHYATGEWHLIPRAHWQQKSAVESAVDGFEWRLRGRWPGDLDHVCPIHAARRVKHAGGKTPEYDWDAAYNEMRNYTRVHGLPKKKAPLVSHIRDWFGDRNEYPADSLIRGHVTPFFADNSVTGKKAPQKPRET
jgi:hypothetical protein